MNELLPLLAIGAGLYFFWPQIQGLLSSKTSTAAIPTATPPVVSTAPVTAPVSISPTSSTTMVNPAYNSATVPSYVAPAAQTYTQNQVTPVAVTVPATSTLAPKYTLQQIHDMTLAAMGQWGTGAMDVNGWNQYLQGTFGIQMPSGPDAPTQVPLAFDQGQYQSQYWAWASQQLNAMGFSGLSGMGGWYA